MIGRDRAARSFVLALAALAAAGAMAEGDPARGRALVANRQASMCLLCHSGPIPEERFQGNLAPDLAGAGSRHTEAQLRQRIADSRSINPQSIMPRYFAIGELSQVGAQWRGKTIFTQQQLDDVVAYLATLK